MLEVCRLCLDDETCDSCELKIGLLELYDISFDGQESLKSSNVSLNSSCFDSMNLVMSRIKTKFKASQDHLASTRTEISQTQLHGIGDSLKN